MSSSDISIVIPTYRRDAVLCDTVAALLRVPDRADEIVLIDQTETHGVEAEARLKAWSEAGAIRWIRQCPPGTTAAMNRGLREARADKVLFLDDDIVPAPDLVAGHRAAYVAHPEAWAVAGRVLQPEDPFAREAATGLSGRGRGVGLREDLEFPFNSSTGCWVANVMAGNLSVNRARALAVGGFDENFGPPVAFRFETEFAKRVVNAGGRIWF